MTEQVNSRRFGANEDLFFNRTRAAGKTGFKKLSADILLGVLIIFVGVSSCLAAQRRHEKVERYSVKIPGGRYEYQVIVGGTLDEFNTADYLEAPLGSKNVGHKRIKSRFQPNVFLGIENIGDKDIVNPRIVINGRRNWYSADDILAGIIKPQMSNAEKAMAIWRFVSDINLQCHENDRRVDNGSIIVNKELTNPVKWANTYYCSGCQFAAAVICILCQKAGIPPEDTRTVGLGRAHRIAEVRWDGDWHVLDGDERMFHLERDNKTLASIADIAADTELCDRTHGGGFASTGLTKKRGVQYKNNPRKVSEIKDIDSYLSTMSMTLRPGERFVWRWDNTGKYRCGDNSRNIKPTRPEGLMPYQLATGRMLYIPRFDREHFEKGAFEVVNLQPVLGDDGVWQLRTIEADKKGYVVYKISTAYPVVGAHAVGSVMLDTDEDKARIYVSVYRPGDWKEVWYTPGHKTLRNNEYEKQVDISDVLDAKPNPAIYEYYVKYEIFAGQKVEKALIEEIMIETEVQMSAVALPSLSVGTNNVVYTDDSGRGTLVEVTHGWKESSITFPPKAPTKPVEPADGSVVDLKKLKNLSWKAAVDPDGHIVDYHIQISTRPDMLYPVSPNFDRITFAAHPLWPVPKGWLNKGQKYYWRVRARDNWGVWSGWSSVWSFTLANQ